MVSLNIHLYGQSHIEMEDGEGGGLNRLNVNYVAIFTGYEFCSMT